MSDDMTPEKAQALLDGATPGPWKAQESDEDCCDFEVVCPVGVVCGEYGIYERANAHLIAAAPDLARAYLAAADRIEALVKARDEYKRLAVAGELAAQECRIWQQQAETAKAEVARLRETLTTIKDMGTKYGNATVRRITAFAAAALKGDAK